MKILIAFLFLNSLPTVMFAQVQYTGGLTSFVSVKESPFYAKGDTQEVTDAALSNGTSTVTSASGLFVAGDVGKACVITSFTGQVLNWQGDCTITGFTNSTTITVSITASAAYTGATFDWGTDDTAAIVNAWNSLTSGGTLYFPPSRYMTKYIEPAAAPSQSNVTLRGFNRYASVIVAGHANYMFQLHGTALTGLNVEDLGFDGLNNGSGFLGQGQTMVGPTFNNCRFYRVNFAVFASVSRGSVTNSIIESAGTNRGTGLVVSGGGKGFRFSNNICRFVYNCLDIGSVTPTQVSEDVEISNNRFDGGWFLGSTAYTNSGGTVTYTATALTDTAANFPTLTANTVIRVLAVRATGTASSLGLSAMQLVDAGATFVTSGVLRGDLIYTGTAVAMVSAIQDETHLIIDEWLDKTTRLPVVPAAAAYTIYKLVYGKYSVSGSSATVLNTGNWIDFYGNTSTPAAGTLYEVTMGHGNYNIQLEYSVRRSRIINNSVKRGWADNVSVFGSDVTVADNDILDGQDSGITVNGDHNIINGNHIFHSGSGGIFANCTQCSITGNNISYSAYANTVNTVSLGDIIMSGNSSSYDMTITGNVLDGGSNSAPWNTSIHRYGIVARAGGSNPITGVTIIGNRILNHTVADIQLDGGGGGAVNKIEIYGNGPATINAISGALYSTPGCNKYTLSNNGTNWTVAVNGGTAVAGIAIPSAATSSPVLFVLPVKGIITSVREKTTTAWSGTGFTTMTLSVGDSVGGASYYTPASYDMFAAVSNTNFRNTPLFKSASDAGTNVTALITGNQNLNTNTITGVTDIEVCSVTLP